MPRRSSGPCVPSSELSTPFHAWTPSILGASLRRGRPVHLRLTDPDPRARLAAIFQEGEPASERFPNFHPFKATLQHYIWSQVGFSSHFPTLEPSRGGSACDHSEWQTLICPSFDLTCWIKAAAHNESSKKDFFLGPQRWFCM